MAGPARSYFDHAATTPPDPRVVEAMLPYYRELWGNPSSIYQEGQQAHAALDEARRTCASALGAKPNEIVFTSGGTESDNLALRGIAHAARQGGDHIITTAIEHHAVLHAADKLEHEGFRVTYLPVDGDGFVDPSALEAAITDRTMLVSIMYANNEIGVLQPLAELSRRAKARRPSIVFHTDAVQAAGYLPLNVDELGVDLLSLSAHKLYGPKGVGLLYVRSRTPFGPQTLGGSQERNRRAGTENVPGIVGMTSALRLATEERDARAGHARRLRDRILSEVRALLPDVVITGPLDGDLRLPNNVSLCLRHVEGESVLLQLDLNGISASAGSACTTGSADPSHVLTAIGVPSDLAHSALRMTVGKDTTDADVDRLIEVLTRVVADLRSLSGAGAR